MEKQSPDTLNPANPARTPAWWLDHHTSAWDRVKDALRRDWDQTKTDLFSQDDREPGKALDRASAEAAVQIDRAKAGIAAAHVTLEATILDARKKLVDGVAEASEAIEEAQDEAVDSIAKEKAKISKADTLRAEALSRWHQAEAEARYGFAVRTQHPTTHEWNDKLEATLRTEWTALGTGRSWDESRTAIRRGWDFAGKSH